MVTSIEKEVLVSKILGLCYSEEALAEFLRTLEKSDLIEILADLLVAKNKDKRVVIPISIFKNNKAGSLEAIVKFLRENLHMANKDISELLGKSPQSLSITYRNSVRKISYPFNVSFSKYDLPATILNSKKSVLQAIVSYLKDNFGLRYHDIAELLNRDDRTIWTVYNKTKKR